MNKILLFVINGSLYVGKIQKETDTEYILTEVKQFLLKFTPGKVAPPKISPNPDPVSNPNVIPTIAVIPAFFGLLQKVSVPKSRIDFYEILSEKDFEEKISTLSNN